VIAAAFDEAGARDPAHLRTWVVLVDGAEHELDVIRAEAARRAVTISEPDLPRPGEPPPTASLLGRASREHHGIRAVRRLWRGGYG
jgi:hypothetical protein